MKMKDRIEQLEREVAKLRPYEPVCRNCHHFADGYCIIRLPPSIDIDDENYLSTATHPNNSCDLIKLKEVL